MKSLDNDALGVIFRYIDDNNYYRFMWNSSQQYARIEKRENGVLSVLAQKNSQYEIQKEYRVQISVKGSQIDAWVEGGTPVFSLSDNSFDQGTIGLYSSNNAGSTFDDVVVTDLLSGQVLLADNFNDGDHTGWTILDEAGTTDGPSVWAVANGSLVQTSNVGSIDRSKGTFALYTKGSWSDYTFAVNVTSHDDDFIGVMFRYHDNANYYRFSWKTNNTGRLED
jgi:hypothetical protein